MLILREGFHTTLSEAQGTSQKRQKESKSHVVEDLWHAATRISQPLKQDPAPADIAGPALQEAAPVKSQPWVWEGHTGILLTAEHWLLMDSGKRPIIVLSYVPLWAHQIPTDSSKPMVTQKPRLNSVGQKHQEDIDVGKWLYRRQDLPGGEEVGEGESVKNISYTYMEFSKNTFDKNYKVIKSVSGDISLLVFGYT